ncbi:MAG: ATP-binding cassette domain-containing protein [Phormidesmis sp.]
MVTSAVISIQNLCHAYGRGTLRQPVLFDIDLTVHAGEIVILTGPSGSGKTTLLSLIGGLRSVQAGSLSVLGRELCGASNHRLLTLRRQLGYIFQRHNLVPFLTACQNVQIPLELVRPHLPKKVIRNRSMVMLEAVGLGHRVNYHPEQLSEGQKQRVAIARALVTQPQIILADEPTASLDRGNGRVVVEILQDLARRQKCSILMITHDHRILDVADRLIEMEDGRLSYLAKPAPTPVSSTNGHSQFRKLYEHDATS